MNLAVADKLTNFFDQFPNRAYAEGALLVMGGTDPQAIFYLQSGIVEQYDIDKQGNRTVINIYKPGTYFPMSWALNGTPNRYFFSAVSPVVVRRAEPHRVVAFLCQNPEVLLDLLARVYRGMDALLRRTALASRDGAVSRLAFEILTEGYRFGTLHQDGTIMLTVKRSDLAARCGMARETVSRALRRLEDKSVLQRTEKGVRFTPSVLEQYLETASP